MTREADRKERLHAVLGEYSLLRTEMLDRFKAHIQIMSLYAPALLLYIGLVLNSQKYLLFHILPLFSLAFVFRVLWEQQIIRLISAYLQDIEEVKLPALVGRSDALAGAGGSWVGWQSYYAANKPAEKRTATRSTCCSLSSLPELRSRTGLST